MYPCKQHLERMEGHCAPDHSPQLDNPCWNFPKDNMDTEAAVAAVAGKTEDKGCWLGHNILASVEAGADTSLAVG